MIPIIPFNADSSLRNNAICVILNKVKNPKASKTDWEDRRPNIQKHQNNRTLNTKNKDRKTTDEIIKDLVIIS